MGSEGYVTVTVDRAAAARKVNPPAIALMVVGGIGVLWHLVSLVANLLGTGLQLPAMAGNDANAERALHLMSGGVGILFAIIGVATSGLIIFGAMKMRSLTGYGLALASAIVALIPGASCHCCCFGLPGLPFGIWALIVLLDNNVKQSFS